MVKTCCVYKCPSESYGGCLISFHGFPKNEERRRKWLSSVQIRQRITKNSSVCSRHFEPSCFITANSRQLLKADAVPTIPSSTGAESRASTECRMIVNTYKRIRETWPESEPKFRTRICKKTAAVLRISLAKLFRVLNKTGVDYSDELIRPSTPTELGDGDAGDTSAKNNNEIKETPVKSKQQSEIHAKTDSKFHENPANNMQVELTQVGIHQQTNEQKTQTARPSVYPKISVRTNLHTPLLPEVDQAEDNSMQVLLEHYECPLCKLLYPTSGKAVEHMQSCHSREGISSDCIRKVAVQNCPLCKKTVKSLLMHQCDGEKLFLETSAYHCAVCKKVSTTIRAFDNHVMKMHGEVQETMYFPSFSDFLTWKKYMEKESGVQYTVVEEHDSKKFYRCESTNRTKVELCPGLMVAQEFGNGVHAVLYEAHVCGQKNYTMEAKYKKYCISKLLKPVEGYVSTKVLTDDSDQYLQFKTLLENIVVDAAKINIAGLKMLMSKALEMTSILTNYDEEVEESVDKQYNLSDAQIADALQDTKRSSDDDDDAGEAKRPKFETMSPMILNTFSLANVRVKSDSETAGNDTIDDIDAEILKSNMERNKCADGDNLKESSDGQNAADSSKVTFNDTYKDFVTKNFVHSDKPYKSQWPRPRVKRPVVKTKIGQFNPARLSSNTSQHGDKHNPSAKSDKDSVSDVIRDSKVESKNVNSVPSAFPKKVDFEYEVIEQEAGYNILVLKV
ncbi:uncharacterized protein LOC119839253 isoform X2 [Zerene cesonia]|uniref:uncharacterized protein LOC119839253 isoform X2 n=1 Tax=Zerene cesonia TaxID=33412 RepID=UPI0018E5A008|nr:uncharacterized protein LOC119839253 isoform X2 [Zerene cesonia]